MLHNLEISAHLDKGNQLNVFCKLVYVICNGSIRQMQHLRPKSIVIKMQFFEFGGTIPVGCL